jgi:hypothetical protein
MRPFYRNFDEAASQADPSEISLNTNIVEHSAIDLTEKSYFLAQSLYGQKCYLTRGS